MSGVVIVVVERYCLDNRERILLKSCVLCGPIELRWKCDGGFAISSDLFLIRRLCHFHIPELLVKVVLVVDENVLLQ